MAPATGATAYLVNHVVLPPDIPQAHDYDISHERILLETTIQSLHNLESHVVDGYGEAVTCATASIKNLLRNRDGQGYINQAALLENLDKMVIGTVDGVIPLEVKMQNAGLLIRRDGPNIFFESFELSPTNEATTSCTGRLKRVFPGLSSKISVIEMQEAGLRQSLASSLASMSVNMAPDSQPTDRADTIHPGLVTDYLMNVLSAVGESATAVRISKHTREDVLLKQTGQPWRRSPLWLLVRVTLHLIFSRKGDPSSSPDELYKAFVVLMLSRILALAKVDWHILGLDSVRTISAKLIRRLHKFKNLSSGGYLRHNWQNEVHENLVDVHNVLHADWKEATENTKTNIKNAALLDLRPMEDLNVALPKLDGYLSQTTTPSLNTGTSDFKPTFGYPDYMPTVIPKKLNNVDGNQIYLLAAMERWVEKSLEAWVEAHDTNPSSCGELWRLMQTYHSSASIAYAGHPTSMSVMYLTLLDLWIQCDALACRECPLLRKYDLELQLDELQCLSLPLKSQMQRLHDVEVYVQSRRTAATKANPSIYRDFGKHSSFAVKYFESQDGSGLQILLAEVQRVAAEKHQAKCKELLDLQLQYQKLTEQYNDTDCEYEVTMADDQDEVIASQHSATCSRCILKDQANELNISVYEWPLSDEPHLAMATIFELKIPEAFSHWRDATYYLVTAILGIRDDTAKKPSYAFGLDKHNALSHMLSSSHNSRRIAIVSTTKSHTTDQEPREPLKAISTLEESDVCVVNQSRYKYYDRLRNVCIDGTRKFTEELPQKCSYTLPRHSKCLEQYMHRQPSAPDGLPSNPVIADQAQCPAHFSTDEFKAFCTIPLGCEVMYENILVQLAMPSIDFAKTETQYMLQHIVHQTGPLNGQVERTLHWVLQNPDFCNSMLSQLETALEQILENWEAWRALATFCLLARRILSLNSSEEVIERSLKYLGRVRQACLQWLHTLESRATASTDHDQRSELYLCILDIALLGISTFDVDEIFYDVILDQRSAILALLQFSIRVRENQESLQTDMQDFSNVMHQSWKRLMYRVFPTLQEQLLHDSSELDQAILVSWPNFQTASDAMWTSLDEPQKQWFRTTSGTLVVYFDLLTGTLLVNGKPLTRLSNQFTQHGMYARLLGKTILEVGPSDEVGMQFSTKSELDGYRLHLGIRNSDMLLLAIKDTMRLEILPSRLFEDSLPHTFVAHYMHWYDREKNEVVLRDRTTPWSASKLDWRLTCTGTVWRLVRGAETCFNISSKSSRTLLHIFRPLEDVKHIQTTWNTTSEAVCISLPRLQLDFYIAHGTTQIKCRQYRSMAVDSNQNIGTLVGLTSKLVMRGQSDTERMVLIPLPREFGSGTVSYNKTSVPHHVEVTINRDDTTRVCAYVLDTILGRIIDSGDLQSKLLLTYLHALTSHCLPDSFTGCTGTEAALRILRSASIRSFETLSAENISILTSIANLAPLRKVQPSHTQQIFWDPDLPVLSQDTSYYSLVKEMFDEAQRNVFLHPASEFVEPKDLPVIEKYVQRRDTIRGSIFKVDGYGAESFTTEEDEIYSARDTNVEPERSERAYKAATFIIRDNAALHKPLDELKTGLFETNLSQFVMRSASGSYDLASLCFDTKWLGDSSSLLAEHWCSLHLSLPKAPKRTNRFNIMLWLSAMAYSTTANMDSIYALGAFYRLKDMASVKPPTAASSFNLARGHTWNAEEIAGIAEDAKRPISDCPEAQIPVDPEAKRGVHARKVNGLCRKNQKDAAGKFVSALRSQWPRCKPSTPTAKEIKIYLDITPAMLKVRGCFKAWHDNLRFYEYLDRVSTLLARQEVIAIPILQHVLAAPLSTSDTYPADRHYAMSSIFNLPAPTIRPTSTNLPLFVEQHEASFVTIPSEPEVRLLDQPHIEGAGHARGVLELVSSLGLRSISKYEKEYVRALRDSSKKLTLYENANKSQIAELTLDTSSILKEHLKASESHFEALSCTLAQVVQGETGSDREIAFLVQQAPRISPSTWLKCLNRENFGTLSESWKVVIVEYARAITHLHRARRMVAVANKPLELAQEIQNVGHTNWSPYQFPETLLLEAESGILVREVQETIAAQMRTPPNGENAVCQLNMGEGKSSVIVPILAAALADAQNLVRIVIAKPQSKQMLQVLISKLGGLLNRRVYHLPFSRELRLSASEARIVRSICQECMDHRGVLLVQPEHILSFKLMSIETVLIDQPDVASSLLDTQQFLDKHTRDIVDESDENFSPHFELVYTMGLQQAIDFAPQRWIIIQQILGLLPKYASQVRDDLPVAIEIHQSSEGAFPRVRTLRPDATDKLLARIAEHVVEYGLTGLPTRAFSGKEDKAALETYITQPVLTLDQIQAVETSKFWTESTKHAVLLVRGLIACGILRFTLGSKRWRVNYGLDLDRTPGTLLAVPYRFKDGPNPRAEYSHPDVLILLTLLSHYYGGLSDEQMFNAFDHLSNSDQSAVQFQEWVATAAPSLPAASRTLSGINLRDRQHCIKHVFPYLRYSKACIDYFLSRLVFPKEIRQFTSKLSASGWDLGAVKTNPTTGFSGTKDTMHLLPLAVKHLDLPSQSHISALVLGYLLDTSSVELLPPRDEITDAEHILKAVVNCKPEIRVIIDCGAAILEQTNKQVAEAWLHLTDPGHLHAAVFFEEEELSVLDRTGRIESFQTSPFSKQLDSCVVYLDEAHSRGTDLRLPRHYRACLTLGLALSKDKLIQGCMRMRQLGKGQSVAFLVPEEIATKIYEITTKDFDDPITVHDVLLWAIQETWADLRKSMALWAFQGHHFVSHEHIPCNADMTVEQAKEHLEDEGQNLEYRYQPGVQGNKLDSRTKDWDRSNPGIAQILERCHGFGAMGSTSADFDEEQERELAPEQEEEREVERPNQLEAAIHVLHDHLDYLVKNGRIKQNSKQFIPAFQALDSTSAAKLGELSEFPTDLLVTADFARTIKKPAGMEKEPLLSDSFQRMVQWVLSVPCVKKPDTIQHLVILSPHEANKLMPIIRKSKKVTLHLFSPRVNSSYAPLDALDLYQVGCNFTPAAVPRSLTTQLNLFAGSLYLSSFQEYIELCDFLGLSHTDVAQGQQVATDGFVTPPAGKWALKQSPVPLLCTLLMRIRKEGEGLEKTHLGKILSGVRLEEADFVEDVEMSGT